MDVQPFSNDELQNMMSNAMARNTQRLLALKDEMDTLIELK